MFVFCQAGASAVDKGMNRRGEADVPASPRLFMPLSTALAPGYNYASTSAASLRARMRVVSLIKNTDSSNRHDIVTPRITGL